MTCNFCNCLIPDDGKFCPYCGKPLDNTVTPTSDTSSAPDKAITSRPRRGLSTFTNIAALVLTAVAMVLLIIAINLQDAKRDLYEVISPSVAYMILLIVFGVFGGFAIVSLRKNRFKLLSVLSLIPIVATIIAVIVSVGSRGYDSGYTYVLYVNRDIISELNAICLAVLGLIVIVSQIPWIVLAVTAMSRKRRHSIAYREKCYQRVEKIHGYLEKGIISEEEFETIKADILQNIL